MSSPEGPLYISRHYETPRPFQSLEGFFDRLLFKPPPPFNLPRISSIFPVWGGGCLNKRRETYEPFGGNWWTKKNGWGDYWRGKAPLFQYHRFIRRPFAKDSDEIPETVRPRKILIPTSKLFIASHKKEGINALDSQLGSNVPVCGTMKLFKKEAYRKITYPLLPSSRNARNHFE